MQDLKEHIAMWVEPSPGKPGGIETVKASVMAVNREHALAKLFCNTAYQMSLLIVYGDDIDRGIFNHQFLMWLKG